MNDRGIAFTEDSGYGHLPGVQHHEPSVDVLARVGDKWTVLVLMHLADGPQRFNQLRRSIGRVS